MVFIRVQNLVKNEDGNIVSGSAKIVESIYVKGEKYHSKQIIREHLGSILYLSDDKKSGIFLSQTRGLVEYDARTDSFTPVKLDDKRLQNTPKIAEPRQHTVFGDTFLLLDFLKKIKFLDILRTVFPSNADYEREMCHLLHGVLKDGSRIRCDDFIEKSFVSYLLEETIIPTLSSDTAYFKLLGDDAIRVKFFKTFIKHMRRKHSGFGYGCYVDSTPLPNEIDGIPFNAFCNHGTGDNVQQTRLILVLDQETGLPIWYDIIAGNVLDLSTIRQILEDVEKTLDIEISELILDAGYASKELLECYVKGDMRSVICRMPRKKGYPYKELYRKNKDLIGKAKYCFIRKNHTYFGKKESIEIFKEKYYVYVFVDKDNALIREREYILTNPEKYEKLTNKEKDWRSVSGGFFVLISTWDKEPTEILDEYFCRTNIEDIFKTGKEYLDLLPLRKWNLETLRGKILSDIINTIVYLQLRGKLTKTEMSVTKIIGKTQSLMCFKGKDDYVIVDAPNKQTKEAYNLLKIAIPPHVNLIQFKREFGSQIM